MCCRVDTATGHERTPLIDEIERLVLQDNLTDQIPGYVDDEIMMLNIPEIDEIVEVDAGQQKEAE